MARGAVRGRRGTLALAAGALAVLVAAVWGAGGAALPGAAAAGSVRVWLPLVARSQDVRIRPPEPTRPPVTATPTDTLTPTASNTPRPTATPTVFVCPALADRLRVRSIDVYPRQVQIRLSGFSGTSPIYVAPDPLGDGAHVAWADTEGSVHVTALDYYDLPTGQEWVLDGDEVRGLVVQTDGLALLVVRGDSLYFVRLDQAGAVRFENRLVGGGSQTVAGNMWVDSWGHEARLVWDGRRYGIYSGVTEYFGARGKHQGDLLWFFDASGQRVDADLGWDWGCSHSLDLRLAYNGTRFGPVCLSDSYPAKGFNFNHDQKLIRSEPSGDGSGHSDANLGGWVPLTDGFVMSFSSPQGRASSDVGVVHVSNQAAVSTITWLTNTANVQESAPHLARYGTGYVADWSTDDEHDLVFLDDAYRVQDGPVAIQPHIAAKDDMVTFPNGDVVWAYSWEDRNALQVARLEWCDDSVPPPTPRPTPSLTPQVTPGASATVTLTGPSTTPGTPATPGTPVTPPTPPEACSDVITNGDFERGLADWQFDGEVALGASDRAGGRYGAMFLGRNAVKGQLSQQVRLPAGTSQSYVTYWWHMTSDEPEALSRAYDTVTAKAGRPGAAGTGLEVLSNLAARDVWLPSGYPVTLDGDLAEVAFVADSNGRDPSRITVDQVALWACTGSPGAWPSACVDPATAASGADLAARIDGLGPGEAVSHWLLEPGALVRHDLGTAAAGADGVLQVTISAPESPGLWAWRAIGQVRWLPAGATFQVTAQTH